MFVCNVCSKSFNYTERSGYLDNSTCIYCAKNVINDDSAKVATIIMIIFPILFAGLFILAKFSS